jgi:hypothetical protein
VTDLPMRIARFREESGPESRILHPIAALKLMTVHTRPHRLRNRPQIRRRPERSTPLAEGGASQAQPQAPQARERAAGGPQDRAAYRCSCGYVFEAPVSTSVGCPHCGDTQAW